MPCLMAPVPQWNKGGPTLIQLCISKHIRDTCPLLPQGEAVLHWADFKQEGFNLEKRVRGGGAKTSEAEGGVIRLFMLPVN